MRRRLHATLASPRDRWRSCFAALATPGGSWPRRAPRPPADRPRPRPAAAAGGRGEAFHYFSFLSDPQYDTMEQVALWVVLLVAVAGLVYAGMLVGQVLGADQGTREDAEVADGDPRGGQRLPVPPVQGDRRRWCS